MTIVNMPALGESVAEGQIGEWLVKEGDRVERDQPLVTVLTDKADTEIPAPEAGVVTSLKVKVGDTVAVGTALCEIDPSGKAAVAGAPAPAKPPAEAAPPSSREENEAPAAPPSVRKLAREHDVDLAKVRGSGEGGRITRDDVLKASEPRTDAPRFATPPPPSAPVAPAPAPIAAPSTSAFKPPPYQQKPGDEVIPFSRRRRIIADHMVYSKLTAPHVVTFAETDIHRTSQLRDKTKDALKKEGINLTFLAFVGAATCRALRENRAMNARVLDGATALIKDINLGIAVETDEGLVVPVVRHADQLSVRGLARAIGELAEKARDGKLTPDDLAGKTFTISNPGRKGNLVGGAIISQPNVGILRMGEIKKRVVVIEHEGADTMAIHPVMYMALSYDHRVVDGVAANGFLFRIHELLEAGDFDV
jgi:2-oxoglutarate dehydrogenase E2 component (dihydrolipoamide succinyltransferase)